MKKIADSVLDLIGSTPMLKLQQFSRRRGLKQPIWAKVESFNPGGSAKDRVALQMIEDAEKQGLLKPGATIVEPTSGNTGVGLALVGALKSYQVILTMPDNMSLERRQLLKAYGARVELVPAAQGMSGAIALAEQLCREIPGAIMLKQFENLANPQAHYLGTGPEIWQQSDGLVDVFVAGVGTGGTLCGTARYLKQQNPGIKVVAVEPLLSPMLSRGTFKPHGLQGMGPNFVPATFDASLCDGYMGVSDEEAMQTARDLAKEEGLLVGISAGAALAAALKLAQEKDFENKHIVVLLPDTGERYLSTPLFSQPD